MLRKRIIGVALAAVAASQLAACNTMGTKQGFGTVGGAIAGGVIGSQFGGGTGKLVMTGIGTLLGAWAGSEIGASLDRADEAYAQQAAASALERSPTNQPVRWRNPDNGNSGAFVPVRTYETPRGVCREYQQTIVVGGRTQQGYGTACRQPDGSWRIQG